MRESDAFEAAYGRLGATRVAAETLDAALAGPALASEAAARAAKRTGPPSRLLTRLNTMAPRLKPRRRNWRFTD